jgi:hypothetical protein
MRDALPKAMGLHANHHHAEFLQLHLVYATLALASLTLAL